MVSDISKAALNGMNEAFELEWECNCKTGFTPTERSSQCKIAEDIHKVGFKYQTEYEVNTFITRDLGAPVPPNIREGKFDLLIRDKKLQPLAIIEIKTMFIGTDKDIIRICDLLKICPSGKYPNLFGVFAFGQVRHKEADIRQSIKDDLKAMKRNIDRETGDRGCSYCHKDIIIDKGDVVWGAACYEIHYP